MLVFTIDKDCDLYVMVQSTTNKRYTLIIYDLANCNQIDSFHRDSQELDPNAKISVLSPNEFKIFL